MRTGISIAVLAALWSTRALAGEPPLVTCADVWPPYTDRDGGARPGYAAEVVAAALRREGVETRYVTMPWSRCLAEVRAGTAAAAIGVAFDEAPELTPGAEPIGANVTAFFARAGSSFRYRGIASLRGVRLGAVQGYGYGEPLDGFLREGARTGAVTLLAGDDAPERMVAMLDAGRLDALVDDPLAFWATVRAAGRDPRAFRGAGTVPPPSPLLVGFPPGRADLAARYDAGLRGLRASGELAALLERYGVSDWAPAARERPRGRGAP